jgi:hypothetical protein
MGLRVVSRSFWGKASLPAEASRRYVVDEGVPMVHSATGRLARAAVIGLVLAIEVAYAVGAAGGSYWAIAGLGTATYMGLVSSIAKALATGGNGFWDRHSTVNAFLAPFTVAGLYGASRATQVRILADGSVDSYPWMPPAVAVIAIAGLLTYMLIRYSRTGGRSKAIAEFEREAVVIFGGSVLLYILVAQLPGALGWMDVFHEGELLAGARLTEHGLFPWRDLYFVHGPLLDILSPLLGMKVFDESRWGAAAGSAVLIGPTVMVGFYLLHERLLRAGWISFLLTPSVLVFGLDGRFLLFPFALLLLIGVLRSPRPMWAFGLGIIMVAQSILAPELAPLSVPVWAVLGLFELSYRQGGRATVEFSRTIWFSLGALTTFMTWAGYLASRQALDDFFGYYLTFSRGHELTGGIPIQWGTVPLFAFAVIAPVVSVLAFGFFFAVQFRCERLRVEDWAMAALAIFIIYYYRKFLSRADIHVFQPFLVSAPLILYLAHRAATWGEGLIAGGRHSWRWGRPLRRVHPVTVSLAVILLMVSPFDVRPKAQTLPHHFTAFSPERPSLTLLGYATPDAIDWRGLERLEEALDALPNPSGRIFDFTNQPAVFHYLLDRKPATRYYHVSLAIRRDTQRDLLDQLQENAPGVVVFQAQNGLPSWDKVPNLVRHYDVSEYILDEYRPVIVVAGNLLMLRKDLDLPKGWPFGLELNGPVLTDDLYFFTLPCDWRFAPNFLENSGQSEEGSAVGLQTQEMGSHLGLQITLPPGFRSYDWLEVRSARRFAADTFVLTDRPGFLEREIGFRTLRGSGPRYLVPIGSCPQWQGYEAGSLVLLHNRPQDIIGVRLLRSR